jgi:hypothetical protein
MFIPVTLPWVGDNAIEGVKPLSGENIFSNATLEVEFDPFEFTPAIETHWLNAGICAVSINDAAKVDL